MDVPSDYVQALLEKIMDAKIATLDVKITDLTDNINKNHKVVTGLITDHYERCDVNMTKHETKITELFEHKNKVTGALVIIGLLVTFILSFVVSHYA